MWLKHLGADFNADRARSLSEEEWLNETKGKEWWPGISEAEEESRLKEVHRKAKLETKTVTDESTRGAGAARATGAQAGNTGGNGTGAGAGSKVKQGAAS